MKKLLAFVLPLLFSLQLLAQIDFRKETIYFLMTTRFFDGDPGNNRPNEWCSYYPGNPDNANYAGPDDVTWRGDFKGLIEKLDYIKDMGFTAIWITPIVQNRGPLDYHGYHAWDFTKVDPRYESPGARFKDLVDAAHAKGMKVVLDVVTNHSGRFGIKGKAELRYNTDPTRPWGQKKDGTPLGDNPNWEYDGMHPNPDDGKIWSRANLAKMPPPFNQNLAAWNWPSTESFVTTSDPNWYHHSGNGFAQGWDDTENLYKRALADDCPDLNTSSQAVQDYLFEAYKQYIDAGVDAFRWDTWKHMDKRDIFALYDRFKAYKPDLFVFGEVAQKRHELHPVEEINPHWYTWRGAVGTSAPAGVGVIDFYAMSTFHNVFESGGGFNGVMAAGRYDHLYGDPSLLVTFLDNHDFGPNNDWNQRYGGSPENLAACMNFMFTWRGIPSVYYGTEMQFKRGAYTDIHNSAAIRRSINETGRAYYGDVMHQAPNHRVYQHIKKLNAIRKAVPALQSGNWNWAGNAPGNGVGYTRQDGNSFVCVGLAKDGSASFNFTNIPNGVYRDAVTGREVTVSNGSLQFTVASVSAGIYVKDGPGMIGDNGAGYFEGCTTGCTNPVKLQIAPVGTNYANPVTVTMTAQGGTGSLQIFYTLDGSMPTAASTLYAGPFTVQQATTVRAIAVDAQGRVSELEAQRYTFEKAPPVLAITPAAGNYFDPIEVSMIASEGTGPYTIYYTVDGSVPTTTSATYTTPIAASAALTVRALAVDQNGTPSAVVSRSYTFNIPNPVVTPTPPGGNFAAGNVDVTLVATSPRPPVTIRYTLDGSTPTQTSPVYAVPLALSGGEPIQLKYVGEDAEGRRSTVDSATYSFFPIPDITVYFRRPANWSTNVRIHFFNAQPTGALANSTWPGVLMQKECGEWYKYTFSGVTSIGIVFNDGAGRQTADLSATVTNWYNNGWLGTDPGINKPDVDFSADPGLAGVAPFTATFNGSLSTACNGVQSYDWDFGNGQTGSGPQPTTTFSQPGTYMVTLTVTDNAGQTGTRSKPVQVSAAGEGFWVYFKKPAAWSNTVKVQFSSRMPGNVSTAFPGVDMQLHCGDWYKYFFENTTSTALTFSDGGTQQFTGLHANQHTSFIGSRKVLGAPTDEAPLFANFEVTPVTGKQPLTVSFSPEATLACGTIQSYMWDFANGSSSIAPTPTTTYQQQGVYPVNLSVTDNNGRSHQLTKKIVVGPAEGNVKVHLRRPPGWANVPHVYFWAPEPAVSIPAWPGTAMTDEGDGWFVFTIPGVGCANLIFNNNGQPQTGDLLNVCGEQWYDFGWLSQIVPDASLPVRLLNFDALLQQGSVHIAWQVSHEENLKHYVIERSVDGLRFAAIHTTAARNSLQVQQYSHTDAKLPSAGVLYYRLQAVDADGSRKTSRVVQVRLQQSGIWKIIPNPAVHHIHLVAQGTGSQVAMVRLMNAAGQVVHMQKIAPGQPQVTITRQSAWPAGLYYAELLGADGIPIQRHKVMLLTD